MKALDEETGQAAWKHSAGDPEREGRLEDKDSAPQHPGERVQRQGKQITLERANSTLWGDGTGNRGTETRADVTTWQMSKLVAFKVARTEVYVTPCCVLGGQHT